MGFAGSMGEIESVFFREIFFGAAIQGVLGRERKSERARLQIEKSGNSSF
jgi:hypothetical protein